MQSDEFKTISISGEGTYTEKRSKFLAFSHHVSSVDEAMTIVANYRKKYYDARHVCYAYVLRADRQIFRSNDDGEPTSTAGKPILGQINSNELTNILIVVVRYYGGINLGTGGLIVAYRTAAAEAITASTIIIEIDEDTITHKFTYPMMNGVMRVIKDMNSRIISQHFDNTCEIVLAIRKSKTQELLQKLSNLDFE
jgi:uncharacterized YigZ family protein